MAKKASKASMDDILDDLQGIEREKANEAKRRKAADKIAELESTTVENKGKAIVLPGGMDEATAIKVLHAKLKEKETDVSIYEKVEAWPLDGAVALQHVLKQVYGWPKLVPTPGFFGASPPTQVGVKINAAGDTIQVSWGRIELPNIDGYLETGVYQEDGKVGFLIGGVVKRKNEAAIAEIAQKVRAYVKDHSIYKNKAVRLNFRDADGDRREFTLDAGPEFIDIDPTKLDDVVYPEAVQPIVDMTLFNPVVYKEEARKIGMPLKRGTLLEGPYGTGKTLTAYQMAAKGITNGWTFVYLTDVRDLDLAVNFALHYGPCILFAEDVDQVAKIGSRASADVNRLTNVMDGIDGKSNRELHIVFTTNFKGSIDPVFLRPGRVDSVISLTPPDGPAVVRLVRKYGKDETGKSVLHKDLTDDQIIKAFEPLLVLEANAAFIREVVERAKGAALPSVRETGSLQMDAQALTVSALSMVEQLELHQRQMGLGEDSQASGGGGGSIIEAILSGAILSAVKTGSKKAKKASTPF